MVPGFMEAWRNPTSPAAWGKAAVDIVAIEQPGLIVSVYSKKDKRYLYLIINMFVAGEIEEKEFCSEYNNSFDLELDCSILTEKENQLFFELSQVVSRFSEYPEDHRLDPKAFTNKEDLRRIIFETKNSLQSRE